MDHLTFCSAATKGSSPQQVICPVLQAALRFTLRMSQSITKLSANENSAEASKRSLGNLYTLVIAAYILWATLRQDTISFVQLAQGTALTVLGPLAGYSLFMACTSSQSIEQVAEPPRPVNSRSSSMRISRRTSSRSPSFSRKDDAQLEVIPPVGVTRRSSTMSKVHKAVQSVVCPATHLGVVAPHKRSNSFPASPASHSDQSGLNTTAPAKRRLSFEPSPSRTLRAASPCPTSNSTERSTTWAKLPSRPSRPRSVSGSSNQGSYGTTTATTFRAPKFLKLQRVFRSKKNHARE